MNADFQDLNSVIKGKGERWENGKKESKDLLYKSLCDSVSLWLNSYIFYSALCLLSSVNGYCLTIEPFVSRIGDKILLTGEGYKPNEEITINLEKSRFKANATPFGTFTTTFLIQSQPGGKRVIRAKSKSREETISFWLKPRINIYPLRGKRGSVVKVSGEGYSPYEKIQIGLGKNSLVAWGTASSLGTFSAAFTVTNQPCGAQNLFAVGYINYLDDKMDFFMESSIGIIPEKGCIGSQVTISGTGFYPSDGPPPGEPIIIDFGSHQTLTIGYTNYYGSFEIPLKVPFCKGGLVNISAKGGYSGIVCSSNFNVAPRIRQFPELAQPIRPMRIDGDGFSSKETITITLEKGREGTKTLTQKKEFLADENGAFNFDFFVDTQPKGLKRITIEGKFGFIKVRNIEIKPYIEIVEMARKYGTLTLKGAGFMEGEDVKVGLMEARYLGTVKADKEGFFLATFIASGIQEKEEIVAYGTKSKETIRAYWEEKK